MIEDCRALIFVFVKNDDIPASSIKLINFKCIISKALPNMDKSHIIRLLFDKRHVSLLAYEGKQMVGGACFAEFQQQIFVELAFLAVRSEKRVQGYGKKIMNKLKSVLQSRRIQYIITYGDNMALGFFKKQGFSDKLTIPETVYEGYIKQYDGGKLMQCKINSAIDYINVDKIIEKQKQYVISKIKSLSINQATFTSEKLTQNNEESTFFQRQCPNNLIEKFRRDPRLIPGVIQSGWTWQQYDSLKKFNIQPFNIRCQKLLASIKRYPQSKYFLLPVSQQQVPTYHKIIKHPMDLQTIGKKLKSNEYKTEQDFCKDIELIFSNCFQFNHQQSVYYKNGVQLKMTIQPQIAAFQNVVINTELSKGKRKR